MKIQTDEEFPYLNEKVEKLFKERIKLKKALVELNKELKDYDLSLKKDFKAKNIRTKGIGDLLITYSQTKDKQAYRYKPEQLFESLVSHTNLSILRVNKLMNLLLVDKKGHDRLLIVDTNLRAKVDSLVPSEKINFD